MANRPPAVVLLALLLFALPAAPASAATKPPSPSAQASQQTARLVTDTRALPSSAIKRGDKAALLRAANRVRKTSRRNPCGAIKLLGPYRRLLTKVRRPRLKDPAPAGSSP